MKPDRWKKIEEVCFEAMGLEDKERESYIISACGEDGELLSEVRSLLQQSESEIFSIPLVSVASSFVFSNDQSTGDRSIGPYQLIREIASGGMGQVFLAIRNDDEFKRFVALKLIRKELIDEDILNRFYAERQILASLNHPYISKLFDGGTTSDDVPWFAMEYVEGEPITDYIKRSAFSLPERIELFIKVCSAVQYAHQNLIIHRDLKPQNILITPNGDPKLLDFGIAKLINREQKTPFTRYQNSLMTPEYASPEQVSHDPVTTVADVYALGVLLYQLLTGSLPYEFKKRSPVEIEKTITRQIPDLPSVKAQNRALQGDLDSVIMKALKKEPAERYASVEQLSGDLKRYLANQTVLARKDTFFYKSKKFISRNKWSVAVSAAIALLILSFSVVTFIQSKTIQARAIEAERERDRAEQVSGFLTDLFQLVSPDQAQDNALSAVELLNRGAKKVEEEFSDQPLDQANLFLVLSDVYETLGSFDEALVYAKKANTILSDVHKGSHPDVAKSLNSIGWLLRQNAEYEKADSFLTSALTMRKLLYGNNHLDVARSLNDLAVLRQSRGDYASTDTLLKEAIEIRRAISGKESEATGVLLSNYAALKYGLGEFQEAENLMSESLEIMRATVGDSDMQTANVMSNLAAIMMVQQNMDGAIKYYNQALEVRLKILGEGHPDLASSYAHLGNIYRSTEQYALAEELLVKAYHIRFENLGTKNELTVDSKRLLGLLYDAKGETEKAEQHYLDAIEGYRIFTSTGNAEMAETLQNLGSLYLNTGNPESAETALREAFEMRSKIMGEEHSLTIESMISLGACLFQNGKEEESIELLEAGIRYLDTPGKDDPDLRKMAENTLAGNI